ncbi:MAG: SDR family oxidoreductase [Chitinophagales bacterium]
MNLDLKGKNALVSGSSSGIGRAIAEELALLGANITLVARSADKLANVMRHLDDSVGQSHEYLIADFGNPNELKTKINAHLKNNNKKFQILVNNTGGPPGGMAIHARVEEYQEAFRKHLVCNHILVQAVLDGMKKSGYGRIINVISTSVKQPLQELGVSNTIRGAVANWSKTLSNELGEFGITVNNILPGATATERLAEIVESKASKKGLSKQAVEEAMKAKIPLKRFAEPNEIAAAAAFLASPAAAYVNGINMPIDGGRTGSL